MKTLLLAVVTPTMIGTPMNTLLHAQVQVSSTATKKTVVFACDMKAMTPAQRKRHSEVLSPALKSSKLATSELPDGYAFQFPSDAKTFATVSEWIGKERLCRPFFEFDVHVGDNTAPMTLRITGSEGVSNSSGPSFPEWSANASRNASLRRLGYDRLPVRAKSVDPMSGRHISEWASASISRYPVKRAAFGAPHSLNAIRGWPSFLNRPCATRNM